MGRFRDPYRPERHYMRGPGPKWHAKHANALVAAAGIQPVVPADAPLACFRTAEARFKTWIMGWIAPTAAAAAVGFMAVMALA